MKEITLYQCIHCNTQYKHKSDCEKCENTHKIKLKLKSKKYLPYNCDETGFPSQLIIEADGKEVIYYKGKAIK